MAKEKEGQNMNNPRTLLAIIIEAASRELKTLLANRFFQRVIEQL
jgi:hypothetical protein